MDNRFGYGKPGWDNPHFVCWGAREANSGKSETGPDPQKLGTHHRIL